jgi:hypothetical protein
MNLLIPKNLTFGKDIKNIIFRGTTIIKTFKNKSGFDKTINFYSFIIDENMFPKLISKDSNSLTIKTDNCGDLLSLYNLPEDWEYQFNKFRKFFIKNNILILDFRFMPHTPYVINNLCTKNNNIYLVDLVLYKNKSDEYINKFFDNIIFQVKLYLRFKKYCFILYFFHFCFEIKRLLTDLFE